MEPILKISLMVEVGEIERQTLKEKCGTMAKLSASANKPDTLGKTSIDELMKAIGPVIGALDVAQEKSRDKQTKDEKE